MMEEFREQAKQEVLQAFPEAAAKFYVGPAAEDGEKEEALPRLPGAHLIEALMASTGAHDLDDLARQLRRKANQDLRKGLQDGTLHTLLLELYNRSLHKPAPLTVTDMAKDGVE